jgi:hypothetical protein
MHGSNTAFKLYFLPLPRQAHLFCTRCMCVGVGIPSAIRIWLSCAQSRHTSVTRRRRDEVQPDSRRRRSKKEPALHAGAVRGARGAAHHLVLQARHAPELPHLVMDELSPISTSISQLLSGDALPSLTSEQALLMVDWTSGRVGAASVGG